MTFDPVLYKTTTREQWDDAARVTVGSEMLAAIPATARPPGWDEIQFALSKYETDQCFTGPCELLVAAGTR